MEQRIRGGGTASEPVSERDTADIPEDTDLGGFTFRIYVRDTESANTAWAIIDSNEENGDLINDAVYKRNTMLEDKYNFRIELIETGTNDKNTIIKNVQTMVSAGDDFADIVVGSLKNAARVAQDGYFMDVNALDDIDLSKDYWDHGLIHDLSIAGKNYFLGGNVMIVEDDGIFTTNFNSALAADFGIENLYDLARDGKWTLDVMKDSIKKVVSDLNADGKYDENDRLGFLYVGSSAIQPWLASAKTYVIDRDGDQAVLADTNKLFEVYETINELYHNQGYAKNWLDFGRQAEQISTICSMFENKQILFQVGSISMIRRFYRDIQTNFGVLPLPKFDEKQDGYATMGNVNTIESIMVPMTVQKTDKIGTVLELMAANSWELDDTYFEVCLQSKYTRDEESYEMFKLATETVIYDLGVFYDFGGLVEKMRTGVMEGAPIASMYESHKSAMETALKEFNEYK